jgi:hypothetical protein
VVDAELNGPHRHKVFGGLDVTVQTHVASARSSACRCGDGDDIVEVPSQTICGGVPSRHCPDQANVRERHFTTGWPVLPTGDVVTVGGVFARGS